MGENKMNRSHLKNFIIAGKFIEVHEELKKINFKELEDFLVELAYETESIAVYSFVSYLILTEENANNHYLASLLLSQPLSHLIGAYQAALYHAKRAIELAPKDTELKEYLLFFYELPDELMSREEAVAIAKEIIKINPKSRPALAILSNQS
jgi:tetratricopeptide (TPR) repeat protein